MPKADAALATGSISPKYFAGDNFCGPKQLGLSINEAVISLHKGVTLSGIEHSNTDAETIRLMRGGWHMLVCDCGQPCVVGAISAHHHPFQCSLCRGRWIVGPRLDPLPLLDTLGVA